MFKKFARGLSALAMSAMLLGAEPIQACCLWDGCCEWFKPKPTTYAPPPACAVCPQQVSYVPQTSYRSECACVPCTTCQPVNACDPCGGAQTVMQPVTSYVRRPVMVPYTSYRPVVTSMNYATSACTTCGASYNSPYYTGAPVAAPSSGCATCGGGSAVTYAQPTMATVPVAGAAPAMSNTSLYAPPAYASQQYAAPAYAGQVYTGQSMMSGPSIGSPGMAAPTMTAPTMGSPSMTVPSMGSPTPAPSGTSAPNTFQPSSTSPPAMPTTPIPDNSGSAPRLLDPQSRTTSAEIIGPASVTHAVFNTADRGSVFHAIGYVPASNSTSEISNDGWSAGSTNNDNWQSSNGR
jgi:hypothetical protein